MTEGPVAEPIEAYLREPTDAHRRAVREVLASRSNYDPEMDVERLAAPYLQDEAYGELVLALMDLMPGAMLSPAVHRLLAQAYEGLGDHDSAGHQRTLAEMSLGAVLASGDGTAARPWAVLRVSDEHDVVAERGLTSEHERYEERAGRLLDLHRCSDGTPVWFDVSLLQEPVRA